MQGQIQTAMGTLGGMQKTINDDIEKLDGLSNSLTIASGKINDINQYNDDLKSDVETLKDHVSVLKDQISNKNNEIDEKNNEIKEQINLINDQINKINQATKDANSNIDTAYTTAVTALNEAKSATDDVKKQGEIQDAIDKLQQNKPSAGSDVLASLIPESFTVSDIDNLNQYVEKVEKDQNDISELVTTLVGTTSKVTLGLKDAQKTLVGENGNGGLNNDLIEAKKKLADMNQLLSQYTNPSTPTVKNAKNFKELVTGLQAAAKKLSAGSEGILGGVQQVNAGLTQLQKKSQAGITQVAKGSKTLSSNSATLNGGASALSQATGTLAGQSGTFNEMADGLDTLGKAFETLNSGAKQLYEGNEQFKSEGLDQLKEKVDLGVGELETLQSVMDEIKAMNKEYASYSGAPEGATVTSRYVFRTKEESSK